VDWNVVPGSTKMLM